MFHIGRFIRSILVAFGRALVTWGEKNERSRTTRPAPPATAEPQTTQVLADPSEAVTQVIKVKKSTSSKKKFSNFLKKTRSTNHLFELTERLSIAICLGLFGIGFLINLIMAPPIAWFASLFGQAGPIGGSFILAGILSVPIAFIFATTRRGAMVKIISFVVTNYIVGFIIGLVVVLPIKASL